MVSNSCSKRFLCFLQVEDDGSVKKIRNAETIDDHLRYFEGL